jgi:predicted DNA-binding antitoxin AbrB/MazE fold protein
MSKTIHAIYANGVFRPTEPVDLPEETPVEFEPRVRTQATSNAQAPMSRGLAKIYEILGRRHSSGHADTAERHNEHLTNHRVTEGTEKRAGLA